MAANEALRSLVDHHGDNLPLDRALLALARDEYPDLDEGRYRRQLDRWAAMVTRRIAEGTDAPDAVVAVLFREVGLRGNTSAYYDPANSLFNQVLERRLGIPITLAAVYVEVARRAGLDAYGVGFPGHFLVGHRWRGEEFLLDAFAGGERMSRHDCEARLDAMSQGQTSLAEWMLAPASGRDVVARVLTNLKVAYAKAGDIIQAIRAINRLLIVVPERHFERRDRGLLYAEIDLPGPAATDLEAYLAATPDAEDRVQVLQRLPQLRSAAQRMN